MRMRIVVIVLGPLSHGGRLISVVLSTLLASAGLTCGRRRTSLHFAGPMRETRPLLSADEEKERKRCDLRARLRDRRPKGEGRKGGREGRTKEEGSHSGEQQQ